MSIVGRRHETSLGLKGSFNWLYRASLQEDQGDPKEPLPSTEFLGCGLRQPERGVLQCISRSVFGLHRGYVNKEITIQHSLLSREPPLNSPGVMNAREEAVT